MSWAQWFYDSPVPGILRNKWIEPRHMQHGISRWTEDKSKSIYFLQRIFEYSSHLCAYKLNQKIAVSPIFKVRTVFSKKTIEKHRFFQFNILNLHNR